MQMACTHQAMSTRVLPATQGGFDVYFSSKTCPKFCNANVFPIGALLQILYCDSTLKVPFQCHIIMSYFLADPYLTDKEWESFKLYNCVLQWTQDNNQHQVIVLHYRALATLLKYFAFQTCDSEFHNRYIILVHRLIGWLTTCTDTQRHTRSRR